MSDEPTETSSSQDDSTVRPPATTEPAFIDPLDGDPYALGVEVDDEDVVGGDWGGADDTLPAESKTEPAPEVQDAAPPAAPDPAAELAKLQEERDRLFRQQQRYYEDNKLLKRQVALLERLEQREADLEEDEEFDIEDAPDPVTDPIEAARWEADRARQAAERVERKIDQRSEEEQRRAFIEETGAWAGEQHKAFVVTHPDYENAAAVVAQRVLIEPMKALGKSDTEIAKAMSDFTTAKILEGRKAGFNPSEAIYNMALQLGYKPSDPSNGSQPPAPAAAANRPTPIQKAAERAKDATTLAAAAGSSGHKGDTGSIAMILREAEKNDPLGHNYQAAFNMVINNVKKQLGASATDDDAIEAIDTGLIKTLK